MIGRDAREQTLDRRDERRGIGGLGSAAASGARRRTITVGDLERGVVIDDGSHRRAVRNRCGEESGRRGRRKQCGHACRACGLTADRHPFGIAAERPDVAGNPAQPREHVAKADVARGPRDARPQVEEPERPDAVADVHDDEAGPRASSRALEVIRGRIPADEAAAVNPDEHGGISGTRGRPNLQAQTVLAEASSQGSPDGVVADRLPRRRPGIDGIHLDGGVGDR